MTNGLDCRRVVMVWRSDMTAAEVDLVGRKAYWSRNVSDGGGVRNDDIEILGRQHAPSSWSVWASPISDGSRSAAEVRRLLELVEFWPLSISVALWMCWETRWKYALLTCRSLALPLGGTMLAVRPVLQRSGVECQACGTPPTRWRTVRRTLQLRWSSVNGLALRTAGLTRPWRRIHLRSLQWCLLLGLKAADVRSAVWLLPTCCLRPNDYVLPNDYVSFGTLVLLS